MFYGWAIVAVAFASQFVVMGALIQCFPVFLLPLAEEFGIGRAQAALPPAAIMGCSVVVGPVVGRLVAIFPIRNVMLVGAIVMAAGFAGLSQATTFWQFLLLFGISGSVAMTALGTISCNSLIVNWFDRQRAMALGIAMIGMSISGAVMIPIASWAVATWGWRAVYVAFGAISLGLMPAVAWLVVSRPSDMGLVPDGDVGPPPRAHETESAAAPTPPPSTREILARRSLWLIAAACGLVFFGATGIMNHGIAFAVDRGIEPIRAAILLAAISIGAAIGKLVFGWLSDRLGERSAFAVALVCSFAALAGLLALSSYGALIAASALFGLGMGGVAPLQAALLAREFGARDFAPVMGLVGPLMIPFQIAGPPLAGYIFDARGSYDLAIWVFMGSTLAAGGMVAMLPVESETTPSNEPEREPAPEPGAA